MTTRPAAATRGSKRGAPEAREVRHVAVVTLRLVPESSLDPSDRAGFDRAAYTAWLQRLRAQALARSDRHTESRAAYERLAADGGGARDRAAAVAQRDALTPAVAERVGHVCSHRPAHGLHVRCHAGGEGEHRRTCASDAMAVAQHGRRLRQGTQLRFGDAIAGNRTRLPSQPRAALVTPSTTTALHGELGANTPCAATTSASKPSTKSAS
mgnify:CR=1 FL=1